MRFTKRAFELLESGELSLRTWDERKEILSVMVSGSCPRCLHPHTDTALTMAVGVGEVRMLDKARRRLPTVHSVVFKCKCEEEHAGRDDDVVGCGLEYRLDYKG
jgi:hypothetical protein